MLKQTTFRRYHYAWAHDLFLPDSTLDLSRCRSTLTSSQGRCCTVISATRASLEVYGSSRQFFLIGELLSCVLSAQSRSSSRVEYRCAYLTNASLIAPHQLSNQVPNRIEIRYSLVHYNVAMSAALESQLSYCSAKIATGSHRPSYDINYLKVASRATAGHTEAYNTEAMRSSLHKPLWVSHLLLLAGESQTS